MSFTLVWKARDLEGKRVEVEFTLLGQRTSWRIKRHRHEPWETLPPTEDDWEALDDAMARHLARGSIQPEDVSFVRKLRTQR